MKCLGRTFVIRYICKQHTCIYHEEKKQGLLVATFNVGENIIMENRDNGRLTVSDGANALLLRLLTPAKV